jgi:hypothetical protein
VKVASFGPTFAVSQFKLHSAALVERQVTGNRANTCFSYMTVITTATTA